MAQMKATTSPTSLSTVSLILTFSLSLSIFYSFSFFKAALQELFLL
jgi:predicted membrane protein